MRQMELVGISLLLASATLCSALLAAGASPESPAQRDARMAWWREARFGMFIHWGLYAEAAGEWGKRVAGTGEWIMNNAHIPVADYEKLAGRFNPVKFDATEWVRIAKTAGMKYIVITSKHHDGFCLWDSKVTDYDIMATPFKRDILKELANACHSEGIQICFYHSIMDWHHPEVQAPHFPNYNTDKAKNPSFPHYVETYLKPQLKELLANYGKIGVLWFDGEWIPEWTEEMGKDLYAYCRSIQPDLIVNNRVGKGRQGMAGMSKDRSAAGDFGTPEQEIPATGFAGVDWESCMTMNRTWGFDKNDQDWKSGRDIIRMLVETSSKGGNFLLNVGPTGEGVIPAASVQRLKEVGRWMQVNGQAIYGASASPFAKLSWGRATQKPGKIYLHVFDWPKNGALDVPLKNKIAKASLLAEPARSLPTANDKQILLQVTLPASPPDRVASVIVLEIDGPAEAAATPSVREAADGSVTLLAFDAEVVGSRARLEKKGDNPYNIGYWTNVNDFVRSAGAFGPAGSFSGATRYSCDPASAGSEFIVDFGGIALSGKIVGTKSFLDFVTIELGSIEIPQAGEVSVIVRPKTKPELAVMDLRKIVMKASGASK